MSHKSSMPSLSRRDFVKSAALVAGAGVAMPSLLSGLEPKGRRPAVTSCDTPARPNLLFIITDEERFPQYWPEGWADTYLPNRKRIADTGLTFTQHFCNSAMCSPSRATLYTGVYPAQHGVTQTLTSDTNQHTLQPPPPVGDRRNMATLLTAAGYNVQYRGKWHMSKDPSGLQVAQSPADLAQYGFNGWLPPEAGQDNLSEHFGGGTTNYDTQYASQAADFLKTAAQSAGQPFALFVNFANPHDIMGYPEGWDNPSASDIPPYKGSRNYADDANCFDWGISLPPTEGEDLQKNYKPRAQIETLRMLNRRLGRLPTTEDRLKYVNFYAYLHTVVDAHMGTVLDALDASGLRKSTIIFRMADHGEMSLSHGGLRQKMFTAYEETIHVPLVISNPSMFPSAVQTPALASLIDLMPTLATLVGQPPDLDQWSLKGRDLMPIINDAAANPSNPTVTVQDSILFTFDEMVSSNAVREPCHIRCLREASRKFAMYFDPRGIRKPEYELYDLAQDPTELRNMAAKHSPYYDPVLFEEMRVKLYAKMAETGTLPPGF